MHPLVRIIFTRLVLGCVTLTVVSLIIFFAVELLPGDAAQAILGQNATPETVAALQRQLMLDLPPHERYLHWLSQLFQGNLGESLAGDRKVSELLANRLPNTLFLATFSALIAVPLALTLGVISAVFRNSKFDRTLNFLALATISLPEFFIAYLLIAYLAVQLGWFPPISAIPPDAPFAERIYRSILPALTLTLGTVAYMMRMIRAAIVNVMASPYIEMAVLKGVPPWRITLRHALPNAIAPIANVVALNLAYLVVGVVVVETIFVYPGLGQLLIDAVTKRDLPIVQIISLIFAGTYVLLNLLADLATIVSNPRLLHPS
jgi:peptide/nickel transport system permease protein